MKIIPQKTRDQWLELYFEIVTDIRKSKGIKDLYSKSNKLFESKYGISLNELMKNIKN